MGKTTGVRVGRKTQVRARCGCFTALPTGAVGPCGEPAAWRDEESGRLYCDGCKADQEAGPGAWRFVRL